MLGAVSGKSALTYLGIFHVFLCEYSLLKPTADIRQVDPNVVADAPALKNGLSRIKEEDIVAWILTMPFHAKPFDDLFVVCELTHD
nr:putative integron gene cassette protein [uncultured bacterium]CAS02957.1 putative integron gene cassette protein [uncultured bacterium]